MNSPQGPGSSSEDDGSDGTSEIGDAFADLTGIDVVDGELIPRGKPRS